MGIITSNKCIFFLKLKRKLQNKRAQFGRGGEVVTSSLQEEAMGVMGKFGLYLRTSSRNSFNYIVQHTIYMYSRKHRWQITLSYIGVVA